MLICKGCYTKIEPDEETGKIPEYCPNCLGQLFYDSDDVRTRATDLSARFDQPEDSPEPPSKLRSFCKGLAKAMEKMNEMIEKKAK